MSLYCRPESAAIKGGARGPVSRPLQTGSVTPTLGPHSRDAHGHAELFARLFLSFVLSVIGRITTLSRESRLDAPVIFVRNAVYGHPNNVRAPSLRSRLRCPRAPALRIPAQFSTAPASADPLPPPLSVCAICAALLIACLQAVRHVSDTFMLDLYARLLRCDLRGGVHAAHSLCSTSNRLFAKRWTRYKVSLRVPCNLHTLRTMTCCSPAASWPPPRLACSPPLLIPSAPLCCSAPLCSQSCAARQHQHRLT